MKFTMESDSGNMIRVENTDEGYAVYSTFLYRECQDFFDSIERKILCNVYWKNEVKKGYQYCMCIVTSEILNTEFFENIFCNTIK